MTTQDSPPADNQGADSEHEGHRSQDQDNQGHPQPDYPCCVESELLRAIAANKIPLPGTPLWAVLDGLIQRAAVARLRQVSHAIAGPPHTGKQDGSDHWHQVAAWRDVTSRRQITSVEPCAACGTAVELAHPLPRELYDRLPDLSWVRCESCSAREAA